MMSGTDRGALASGLRAATSAAEPFYAGAARLRNRLFDSGWIVSHRMPRPVISVGNLTTGGTGKTPMIQWLASHLRSRGRRVVILARGYKSAAGALGDEQVMLQQSLASGGDSTAVRVIANPRRVDAAKKALADDPGIDLFLLDDGFQHRAMHRDLDIVLVSAMLPFGYGHVLPRGLLREPMSGLQRAGAIVITHADQVSPDALEQIDRTIRRHNATASLFHAAHVHEGLSFETSDHGTFQQPMEMLSTTPFFGFAGIGDPLAFDGQLRRWSNGYRGGKYFADHHAFTLDDLERVNDAARCAAASVLVTTAKDWAKIGKLQLRAGSLPIWRVDLSIRLTGDGQHVLLEQIDQVIERRAH